MCDYGLYLGATGDNSALGPDLAERTGGLKMYLNETLNALNMDKLEYVRKNFDTRDPNTSPYVVTLRSIRCRVFYF